MLKEFLEYVKQTENLRNVTVVSNPGTGEEVSETFRIPKGLIIGFRYDEDDASEFHLYTDAACTTRYTFSGSITADMTLYAKWVKGGIGSADGGSGISGWIIFLLLLMLGIFLLLLLLFGRKTVTFETDCDIQIPDQKVWKGAAVERPVEPKRPGRLFAGWYCDEMRLRRWDFEEDMVEDNMILYAKWI